MCLGTNDGAARQRLLGFWPVNVFRPVDRDEATDVLVSVLGGKPGATGSFGYRANNGAVYCNATFTRGGDEDVTSGDAVFHTFRVKSEGRCNLPHVVETWVDYKTRVPVKVASTTDPESAFVASSVQPGT
jgi:hypothetical protein